MRATRRSKTRNIGLKCHKKLIRIHRRRNWVGSKLAQAIPLNGKIYSYAGFSPGYRSDREAPSSPLNSVSVQYRRFFVKHFSLSSSSSESRQQSAVNSVQRMTTMGNRSGYGLGAILLIFGAYILVFGATNSRGKSNHLDICLIPSQLPDIGYIIEHRRFLANSVTAWRIIVSYTVMTTSWLKRLIGKGL